MWTPAEVRDSIALREARSNRWAGISFSMPRATFSGRIVEPDPHSTGPFYRFNLVSQQVYFSAFHLRPDTARLYVDALHRHRVQWLVGYAVSYYLLAKFMIEQQLKPPPLQAIITTSEKVTPEMRHIMEQAFACRVYEEYSTVENVIFASECEHGRLHISPDASVVEILRPDGTPCDPGEVGEVVTTCLTRNSQPFIRYRVGDMAAWASAPCPCGRMMPVLEEVTGRIEDVVIGPDGRQMVRFHGIFVDLPHIREGQIIQEALTCIRAKIIPTDEFDEQDEQAVTQRIKQRLGHQVDVIVELVQNIPRTANGKFRAVISQLSPEERRQANRDSVHR
jgi:phenylacetate-CoA ligase